MADGAAPPGDAANLAVWVGRTETPSEVLDPGAVARLAAVLDQDVPSGP